jgi:hypothetical protein
MALAVTSLTNGSTTPTNLTGFTTASVSPAGGSLLILSLGAYDGTGTQDFTVASVSGLSLTWVSQKVTGAGSADKGDVEVWTAVCGASPGSGAITVTFTGAGFGLGAAAWAVDQVTGQNTSTPVVTGNTQAANASSTAPAATFAAAGGSSNLFYAMDVVLLGASGTVVQTPNESPTPWTALDNIASSSAVNNNVALLTTISPDVTNVNAAVSLNASHSWGMIGLELNAAAGVSVSLTTPNLALAAPVLAPQFPGAVTLTTPNLALAAPALTPAGSGAATVALTTPNLALAAPALAPSGPPAATAAQQGDSDRSGLLRKPFLW